MAVARADAARKVMALAARTTAAITRAPGCVATGLTLGKRVVKRRNDGRNVVGDRLDVPQLQVVHGVVTADELIEHLARACACIACSPRSLIVCGPAERRAAVFEGGRGGEVFVCQNETSPTLTNQTKF